MSYKYDKYLEEHRLNVYKGYEWIRNNLPEVLADIDINDVEWQIQFNHDASKNNIDEYEAYDKYFYGNNRSYKVVQNFNYAWLTHIHKNPHHWQHWILFEDDPESDKEYRCLDMPYWAIIEMICDWWSFSWKTGNLYEIFDWYEKHDNIKLSDNTRKTVESILEKIKYKLSETNSELAHHGIKGQKWGIKNGPPYPINKTSYNIINDAIKSGKISKLINKNKQIPHTKDNRISGKSYINGDLEYAQKLVNKLGGTGRPIKDRHGNWTQKERVSDNDIIGFHVDKNDNIETPTNKAIIVYSKTGTHIYPAKKEGK